MEVPRMRIPVFVSAPTDLNPVQDENAETVRKLLEDNGFEWRALGRSDYPTEYPLLEVQSIIKHCSGGIILGFEQMKVHSGIYKRGTEKQEPLSKSMVLPTPWNQLEAGMLFAQQLPILIFKEQGIGGGIFDIGASDIFIHEMPNQIIDSKSKEALAIIFQNWAAKVRTHYYQN